MAYNVANGFALMSEGGADAYAINVFNNLFYNIKVDCAFVYDHPTAAASPGTFQNVNIYNNTFWDCGRTGLDLNTQQLSSAKVFNNILKSYKDRYDNAVEASNLVGGSPKFVDTAADDFHLAPGSPAIDQGTAAGAPGVDLEGTPRPQGGGVDRGAYEHLP